MIDNGNYFGLDEEALKSKYEYVKLETKMEQKSSSSNQIQDLNHSNNNVQIFSNNQYQKLVPPGDFAFALWKKPAYHYVNLKLMRKDLMKLWDHINKRIRNDAIKRNREYYIHTGAYEKTTDQIGNHRNTKNKKSQENTDYWLKIIYYFRGRLKGQNEPIKNTAVAIVMNNNFDNNSSTDSWFDEKCEKNLCENAFVEQFQQIGKSVRCCSLINTQTFNETDLKIDEDLEVDFLYEDYNA
ncbi:uncharacterized protein LOC135835622 [Planococcus citri]|uniref:uncharacterized protein LOC135835622 n=1 Tax=Planococcus citri TaxID=170843 RepID=UPI0031F8D23D